MKLPIKKPIRQKAEMPQYLKKALLKAYWHAQIHNSPIARLRLLKKYGSDDDLIERYFEKYEIVQK